MQKQLKEKKHSLRLIPVVLDSVPETEKSSVLMNLDLQNLPVDRVLGVQWDMTKDAFGFKVQTKSKPFTRRGMLLMVSQIYDPLGFIQPFILPMRRLMQGLCQENLYWDDPLPLHAVEVWKSGLEHLPAFSSTSDRYRTQMF